MLWIQWMRRFGFQISSTPFQSKEISKSGRIGEEIVKGQTKQTSRFVIEEISIFQIQCNETHYAPQFVILVDNLDKEPL